MFCSECGENIPDDSAFCPECGKKIGRVASEQPAPAMGMMANPPPPGMMSNQPPPPTHQVPAQGLGEDVSSGLNIGIIIGSLLFPLIGIVMGVIYMRDSNPAKKSAGKTWLFVGIGAFLFWILATSGY